MPSDDLGGVSQCDPFAQDCPEGEKCVAYASTGGQLDANKCVPIFGDGMPGEACTYGGVVEATDDCNAVSYCWDVTPELTGSCSPFCEGTADAPVCPDDKVEAEVEYLHPLTLEPMSESLEIPIGALVQQDASRLRKADAVVGFAKAIIVIDALLDDGNEAEALAAAEGMKLWLSEAAQALGGDDELLELATLMGEYAVVLGG